MDRPFHHSWRQRLGARLAASDPALTRLRMALRTSLTLVAVTLSLVILHGAVPLPVPAYAMALITALQGALQIKETRAPARARTLVYASLAGFAATALAVLLSPWPTLVGGVFLAVVFAAVWARRFGPRGNAVGMYAFMCYFIAAYLHPKVGDLWAMALAIALSSLVASLVRNHVLAENPVRDFRVTMLAVEGNFAEFEAAMARLEARAARPDATPASIEGARGIAARAEARLKDAILAAEGLLPAESPEKGTAEETPAKARGEMLVRLFDLQIAAETRLHSVEAGAAIHGAVRAERLREALVDARKAATRLPAAAFFGAPSGPASPTGKVRGGWLADPSLRLATQVTLASGIAMIAGSFLSETRWFWAILTAFLVFTNTQSRGDTAVRALARAGGTLAGIVVGIGAATLLGGSLWPSVVLITLFVFVGFYLLQLSYAAMTFCITIVLSLLYGLIGQFTPELLFLRLEETLIGSAAGLFIAFVVFPRSTASTVRDALANYLAAMDALLKAAEERVRGERTRGLLGAARLLDRRHLDLVAAARPLGGGRWSLVRRPGPVRRALIALRSCAYWGHVLARGLTQATPTDADGTDSLLADIAALRRSLAAARETGWDVFAEKGQDAAKPSEEKLSRLDAIGTRDDPRYALAVIARVLEHVLGTPDGEPGRALPPAPPAERTPAAAG